MRSASVAVLRFAHDRSRALLARRGRGSFTVTGLIYGTVISKVHEPNGWQ